MTALSAALPGVLKEIRVRPLLTMKLAVQPLIIVGETPLTTRRIGIVFGGVFEGERLSGEVLDGGSDWQSVRRDGSTLLDVRLNLRTEDGALLGVTYKGIRQGPPDVIARLERGEPVEPERYYFRINPMFETASEKYAWLNNILSIGTGHRFADGPVYNLFEVL
jgi:Protein of unknown function (DUF3237)